MYDYQGSSFRWLLEVERTDSFDLRVGVPEDEFTPLPVFVAGFKFLVPLKAVLFSVSSW